MHSRGVQTQIKEQIADGEEPPIAPFYLPYRKHYPPIPDNHYDIATPKDAIEELDRIEEFLKWVSYIFEDGSTYVYIILSNYYYFRYVWV